MPQGIGAEVPVEALLKVVFDKSGGDSIQQFLDQQNAGWKTMADHATNVSGAISNISSTVQKLAGAAAIGALVKQFSDLSDSASEAALAAGVVTGGSGSYGKYGSALTKAQATTGVSSSQIAQGFIQAVMMVGGRPSPAQAGMIGALLGGFGLSVGMTPAQVAQVIGPILLNTGQSLTAGSAASVAATLQQGLAAQFPGSQGEEAMPVVASTIAAIAQGTGGAVNPAMTPKVTAMITAAARLNPALFGHGGVLGQQGALAGISGGLQNAMSNPALEAALSQAGIGSYAQQRLGATPANILALVQGLAKSQPNATSRDIMERQDFGGIQGANLLNTFSTPQGIAALEAALKAKPGSVPVLNKTDKNAQAATTPDAILTKAAGGLEHAVGGLEQTLLKWTNAIEKFVGPGVTGVGAAAAPVAYSLVKDAAGALVLRSVVKNVATKALAGAAEDTAASGTADVVAGAGTDAAVGGVESLGLAADSTGVGLPVGLTLAAVGGLIAFHKQISGLVNGAAGDISSAWDSVFGGGGGKKKTDATKVNSDGTISLTATDSLLSDILHQQKLTVTGQDKALTEYTKDSRDANTLLSQIYHESQITTTALNDILAEYKDTSSPGGTPKTPGNAKATASNSSMAKAIMADLGIKPTSANMTDLESWMAIEGGTANNPLNSSQTAPGSHGNRPGMPADIQAYASATSGAHATAETLSYFKTILQALTNGTTMASFPSLVHSAPNNNGDVWGTQGSGWPTVHVYVDGTKARHARVLKKKAH